jgi:hypothetical protein
MTSTKSTTYCTNSSGCTQAFRSGYNLGTTQTGLWLFRKSHRGA